MSKIFFKSEDPEDTGVKELYDDSVCPFGQYEYLYMREIPDDYLIFMRDNLQKKMNEGQTLRDDENAFFNYALGRLVD